MFVPVVDKDQKPLMPTTPSRARKWIETKKATGFWKRGVFCVRLNAEPSDTMKQPIAVGVDSGSKREALTVKSKAHTYLNVLTEAVDWVKDAVERKRNAKKSRRAINTPCRKNKLNRKMGGLAPSVKARWGWKLRNLNWLSKMFPISIAVVEDIKAKSKGQKRWDETFTPLQMGKTWFYRELRMRYQNVIIKNGYETKALRDSLGLKKSSKKLADKFECHNVDSWVLAWSAVGGDIKPENKKLLKIIPLQFHRRQLHYFQPSKGGKRKNYGSTKSLGFTRGSIVKHKKYGVVYVGGCNKDRIAVHEIRSGKRLSQYIRTEDTKFLSYCSWRFS